MRVLIAGVGNVLRGDDGFGVEVLRRLQEEIAAGTGVEFFESGIAGVSLAQQLLDGYDALIILDALDRGAAPGTVFVLEPEVPPQLDPGESVALHRAGPGGIVGRADALGGRPRRVGVVGCQAAACDELGAGLSEPVRRTVPLALQRVWAILESLRAESGEHHGAD